MLPNILEDDTLEQFYFDYGEEIHKFDDLHEIEVEFFKSLEEPQLPREQVVEIIPLNTLILTNKLGEDNLISLMGKELVKVSLEEMNVVERIH